MTATELATGYADILRNYIRAGLVLVPIPAGSKAPKAKGWNLRARCWAKPGHVPDTYGGNVGLAHAYAGTCALDIDNAALAEPALAIYGIDLAALLGAPDAVHIRSGRPRRDKLLFRLRDPLASINRSGPEGFELRCTSKNRLTVQDVLPPSIHPDTGKPYQWAGDWHNIPPIPADLLTLWYRLLDDTASAPRAMPQPARASTPRQRRALEEIPEGERNTRLLSLAAGLVRQGFTLASVARRVHAINRDKCASPLSADEVDGIAARACGYGSNGFTLLPHGLLDSFQWKALSPAARDVVCMAFRRYDGTNNGNIALTEADFADMEGFASNNTLRNALAEVLASGILLRVSNACNTQWGRKPSLYAIAAQWIRQVQNLHVAPSAESAHLHR